MKFRFPLITVLMLGAGWAMAEESMYIQSANAKMFKEHSFSSPVVSEIAKGEAVNVSRTEGRWAFVQYQNRNGWISTLLLAKNPPMKKVSVISEETELGNNARRRASAVATAGATRGLTADERQRAYESTDTNYRALMLVEQISISDGELAKFKEASLK